MKAEKFEGELLSGHKLAAVEVPFDPALRWQAPKVKLWPGRRGYRVSGTVNGAQFDSSVVSRSSRFYVLIPDELRESINIGIGDPVEITLEPATMIKP